MSKKQLWYGNIFVCSPDYFYEEMRWALEEPERFTKFLSALNYLLSFAKEPRVERVMLSKDLADHSFVANIQKIRFTPEYRASGSGGYYEWETSITLGMIWDEHKSDWSFHS